MKRLASTLFALLIPALAIAAGQPVEISDPTDGYRAAVNSDGTLAASLSMYPSGATAINASSGNVANASAVATLSGAASKTTHICGLAIAAGGATAALLVDVTITGLVSGTMTMTYGAPAGAAASGQTVVIPFYPCVPASAVNTAIVVTLPALGAGNTKATASAWGYRL